MSPPPPSQLLLPEGARLIHIGPHKTGTTALQSAFHYNRETLAAQGVHYAGRGQQPAAAVTAINGDEPMRGEARAGVEAWDRLVREIHAAGSNRVVVSSEFFANADGATARRVVEDVGPQSHVLITLRPLWKITPSQWQQFVQNGARKNFLPWLHQLLDAPPTEHVRSTFWRRHRHGALVERWAEAVGPDRVTVIAVDDSDRSMLVGVVEQLLGLSRGTLVPHEDRANRTLTWPEAELVRRLNQQYARRHWSEETYATLIRRGAVHEMKRHPPHEQAPRITLPDWARGALEEVARKEIAAVESSGVRIVGDLSGLVAPPPAAPDISERHDRVDPATAAHAVLGVIESGGEVSSASTPRVADSSLVQLGNALANRGAERARRAFTRVRGVDGPRSRR